MPLAAAAAAEGKPWRLPRLYSLLLGQDTESEKKSEMADLKAVAAQRAAEPVLRPLRRRPDAVGRADRFAPSAGGERRPDHHHRHQPRPGRRRVGDLDDDCGGPCRVRGPRHGEHRARLPREQRQGPRVEAAREVEEGPEARRHRAGACDRSREGCGGCRSRRDGRDEELDPHAHPALGVARGRGSSRAHRRRRWSSSAPHAPTSSRRATPARAHSGHAPGADSAPEARGPSNTLTTRAEERNAAAAPIVQTDRAPTTSRQSRAAGARPKFSPSLPWEGTRSERWLRTWRNLPMTTCAKMRTGRSVVGGVPRWNYKRL